MKMLKIMVGAAIAVALAALVGVTHVETQEQAALRAADPPANGVWVDSLDLSQAQIRRPRAARGARAQPAPTTPPPPLTFSLGGSVYPHAVPLQANADLAIDLKRQAVRFMAMVGIDDANKAGQGSVIFGVWVDGKKVADSGLMRSGDAPKFLSADLTGASRLVLAVSDASDGTRDDVAEFGGALILMAPGTPERPAVMPMPAEPAPVVAPSRSAVPQINSPRITGGTPGRPFQFLIPASGDGALTFAAKNLPAGLTLDSKTGLVTGSLKQAGPAFHR